MSKTSLYLLPLLIFTCAINAQAMDLVSNNIQPIKGKSQLSAKEITAQPTNTYELDGKPDRRVIIEICQDAVLFLPNIAQEVTYLIKPNVNYLSDSGVYKLNGEFKFLSSAKVITLQKYECYVVNTGKKYYAKTKLISK